MWWHKTHTHTQAHPAGTQGIKTSTAESTDRLIHQVSGVLASAAGLRQDGRILTMNKGNEREQRFYNIMYAPVQVFYFSTRLIGALSLLTHHSTTWLELFVKLSENSKKVPREVYIWHYFRGTVIVCGIWVEDRDFDEAVSQDRVKREQEKKYKTSGCPAGQILGDWNRSSLINTRIHL